MSPKILRRIVVISLILVVSHLAFARATVAQRMSWMSSNPTEIAQVLDTVNPSNKVIDTMAQAPSESTSGININPETGVPDGAILLTVFLKHDQSKTVDQILEELRQSGYWKAFPPEGVDVVSWYVVMGIGQVVTLAVPPERLRAVNVALERTAWRAYRTEVYPTYDFSQAAQRLREQELQRS